MPSASSYLSLQSLHKEYSGQSAVRDLSLDIARGQFVSLLGPSGCGKSTTLRMIAGLEDLDGGRIILDGENISYLPTQQRRIGMVFQSYALFPNMTVAGNVAFGLRMKRMKVEEQRRRVVAVLETVGLDAFAERYPFQLSGGQQQRVAVARALAPEPRILLLDEPLSALDAVIRTSLRDELRALQLRLGITTIYVTHDQEEALAVSDRVVVMSQGIIEQQGAPEEVYLRPATRFVAGFVGAVNRLDVTVEEADPPTVRLGATRLPVADLNGCVRGASALLAVRSEHVRVFPMQGAADAHNGHGRLAGAVTLATFLGQTTRLHVDAAGATLTVDVPSEERGRFSPGQPVEVAFDPAYCIVLP